MSRYYNSYNWRYGTNQYGNRYDHRGEGAARGGSYHYSNYNGSYYYQNRDGSTYYSSPEGYGSYTAPSDNSRYYESSDSDEEEQQQQQYVPQRKDRKLAKTNGRVTKAKNRKKK